METSVNMKTSSYDSSSDDSEIEKLDDILLGGPQLVLLRKIMFVIAILAILYALALVIGIVYLQIDSFQNDNGWQFFGNTFFLIAFITGVPILGTGIVFLFIAVLNKDEYYRVYAKFNVSPESEIQQEGTEEKESPPSEYNLEELVKILTERRFVVVKMFARIKPNDRQSGVIEKYLQDRSLSTEDYNAYVAIMRKRAQNQYDRTYKVLLVSGREKNEFVFYSNQSVGMGILIDQLESNGNLKVSVTERLRINMRQNYIKRGLVKDNHKKTDEGLVV